MKIFEMLVDTLENFLSALLLEAALCNTDTYDCCHLTDHVLIIKTGTTAGLGSSSEVEKWCFEENFHQI